MTTPNDEVSSILNMTTDTIGIDLLNALVTELKLLPDVWHKLPKARQDDVIDRLRKRVESNVKMAVHLLASKGRTVVTGDLDQITIKDGVKAVVKFGLSAPHLQALYESSGKPVLVVVAGVEEHIDGMDQVQGEADQRSFDMGKEYTSKDGEGMQDDQGRGQVIEGEFTALPPPANGEDDGGSTEDELDAAYNAGYDAAAAGQPQSACPVMAGDCCIEWIKGWKAWHEDNANGGVDTAEAA
ncbi:MAG TPA: ribosome modulation factor [Dyella sp.]|nr:ribosome modulation factor [Dyella sp.]